MNNKIALLLFMVLFFTIGTIQASDVNLTDSNTLNQQDNLTLPIAEVNYDNLSSYDDASLKEPVKHQTEITANTNDIYYKSDYSVTLRDLNSSQTIANKKVNFIINGVNYAADTNANGVASVFLTLNPGKYSLTAYFAGDEANLASNTFTSTIQILSTVKASDMTKYYKGSSKYTATFYKSDGSPLANRDVSINVNGKTYTKKTNGNGVASLPVNLKPGSYKVTSTDPVTGYKVTTTFKILSTISSSNLNKVKGDGRKFVAKFFKSNGKPLAKKYIKYKLKGKIHKVKTSSKGNLVLSFKKFKKGTYKIVLYNKDGISKKFKVKIYSRATTRLSTNFYTFLSDEKKEIKAKLSTSLGGDSSSGKIIKIKINGHTYSKRTNSNGEVSLELPSLDNDVYSFVCSYKGNKYYKASKSANLVTILGDTTPELSVVSTKEFGRGAGTLFKVAFTAGGVPLAKRDMTFTVEGDSYTVKTDSNGIGAIPINLKVGTYTIGYKTYDQYRINGTSGSCNISVFERTVSKLSWECGNSYKDSSQSFKFLLKDSNGNPIADETVEMTIDGKTYSDKTDSNGYAKITTSVALGKYKVSVRFKDTNYYISSHVASSIKVKLSRFANGVNEKNKVSSLKVYLKSSKHCKVNSAKIKKLVKKLTKGKKSKIDKAKALFNYVRDNIKYSYYYDTKYGSTGVLKSKRANCVDQSHLLISMYRTAGFKARYVHGKCTFDDGRFGHVWTQVLIGKHWVCGDAISQRNSLGKIANWNTHSHHVNAKYQSLPF